MMEQIIGGIFTLGLLTLAYVGIHMVFEKDLNKHIPLIWEKGGLFDKLLNGDKK